MGEMVPYSRKNASKFGGQNNGHMASDENERWFSDICRVLLPKDAGFSLHVATGIEERTCYRYAAGDRKPSAALIRQLLHSEQGWTWLAAFMDGSDATWWRELQTARDLCIHFEVKRRE